MDSQKEGVKEKVKRSLRYSVLDGAFNAAKTGFGESFFPAFAVFLNANNIQLSLITSLPQTLGSLFQLFTRRLIKFFGSRKMFICLNVFLEALVYIPITLAFFTGHLRITLLILFMCLYWVLNMIITPAWSSWMGDLVNENARGAYFGRRNQIAGLVAFFSFLAAGYILQMFSASKTTQYAGFVIIFAIAMLSRILSFVFLSKKYEPEYHFVEKLQFSFIDFLRQARFRNYGLFVIYLCLMNFAVYLSAPFFTPYMLKDLNMSYATFTAVCAMALVVRFLTMPVWGKLSDRYGTKKILALTGVIMPIVPVLWVFSGKLWYLLLIQAYSGFVWSGFDIAAFNFAFDTTSPEKRVTCLSYYNVLNGFSILAGALLGGLIVRYSSFALSKYYVVFVLSFLLRYAVSAYFLPKLREARIVKDIPYSKLALQVFTTLPTTGVIHSLIAFSYSKLKKNGSAKAEG